MLSRDPEQRISIDELLDMEAESPDPRRDRIKMPVKATFGGLVAIAMEDEADEFSEISPMGGKVTLEMADALFKKAVKCDTNYSKRDYYMKALTIYSKLESQNIRTCWTKKYVRSIFIWTVIFGRTLRTLNRPKNRERPIRASYRST